LTTLTRLATAERHLNLIRAELGLPERLIICQGTVSVTGDNDAQVVQAEFIFVQKNSRTGKQKDLYLTFDVGKVSDLERTQSPKKSPTTDFR